MAGDRDVKLTFDVVGLSTPGERLAGTGRTAEDEALILHKVQELLDAGGHWEAHRDVAIALIAMSVGSTEEEHMENYRKAWAAARDMYEARGEAYWDEVLT